MASDIWLRTILIVRKETRCHHIGYSFRLAARVLLYAPSHRQDSTYHGLCYTSRGALAGTRNSSMGPSHEGSIRRPIAPWVNTLTTELHLALPYTRHVGIKKCASRFTTVYIKAVSVHHNQIKPFIQPYTLWSTSTHVNVQSEIISFVMVNIISQGI